MTDSNKTKSISTDLERILTAPDRRITDTRGIGGILARLWRQILSDINMHPNRFEILLNEFILSAKKHRVKRLQTRGNLRREFENPTMTFKVFMKGMKLLKVKKIRFAVELEFGSGRKTYHETQVDLGDQDHHHELYGATDKEE